MESKEQTLPQDTISGFRGRVALPQLHIDHNSNLSSLERISLLDAGSTVSSPSASASMSPRTPSDTPASAIDGPPESPKIEEEPLDSPGRTQLPQPSAAQGSSAKQGKAGSTREKRKRSRVTPEQLTHLERFFAADRSPTAARRKEISELLGMQERQTQIWFQNRRAKAKHLNDKKARHLGADWGVSPPDTPPQLSAGYEADLHSLIHEDKPIAIIPCTDLSIGSWRRIATGKHDLVAYVCEANRCLTWFIHSAGYGFKMEIPYEIISHTEFRNVGPGEGLASFHLSQPPNFYLENISSSPGGEAGMQIIKSWKKCSDWTEGTQASLVLRHDLVGSAVQLAHVLNDLQEMRNRSAIPLISPLGYGPSDTVPTPISASSSTMHIPEPPLAGLHPAMHGGFTHRPAVLGHMRKRSSSVPPVQARIPSGSYIEGHNLDDNNSGHRSAHPFSAGYTSTTFGKTTQLGSYGFSEVVPPEYAQPTMQSTHGQSSMRETSSPDYSGSVSHVAPPRSYVSGAEGFYYPAHGNRNSPSLHLAIGQPPVSHVQQTITPSPLYVTSPPSENSSVGLSGLSYFGREFQSPDVGSASGSEAVINSYTSPTTSIDKSQLPPAP